MIIHGPDWPSVNLLREKLKDVEGEITWGESNGSKLEQLLELGANGIIVPNVLHLEQARSYIARGKKAWGRKEYHSHGSDIAIIPENKRWNHSDFWVCQ